MKNLKFLVLLFFALSISISGCKKNDPEPETEEFDGTIKTPSGKSCLLTKIKYGTDYSVSEYDSQNRPVKISFYEGTTLEEYVTLTYGSSQILVKEFSAGGQLEATSTFAVSNGVITGSSSTDTWTESGITYTETFQQTFEHNSEGYLTKRTFNETTTSSAGGAAQTYSGSAVYTYQNGNLVSEVQSGDGGSGTTTYEYYTDKLNSLPASEEDFLFTKANKNPVKKRTQVYSQGGDSYITNYTYTFNADGLIEKAVSVETSSQPGSTPYTNEETFEYSCK